MLTKIYFFTFLFSTTFVSELTSEDDVNFRLLNTSLVEVQDESDRFLPLCADSFTPFLAEFICRQHQFNVFESFKQVPLTSITSLNVLCRSNHECSRYLAFGCGSGIEIKCSHKPIKCPKGFHFLSSNKCIKIPKKVFTSYDDSENYCTQNNHSLVSFYALDVKTQINAVIKILKKLNLIPDADTKLLTSGVRQTNIWLWKSGVIYNGTVDKGTGRCLGLYVDQLIAVECDNNSLIPICEHNLAQSCVTTEGLYEGTVSKTKEGLKCLQWNKPGFGLSTNLFPEQKLWNHNYCRNPQGNREMPWCLVGANTFQECVVSLCPVKKRVNDVKGFAGCEEGEKQCGFADQCILSDYFCDYENDCQNGFDEIGCPNFLKEFNLIGDYKLVDDVNEVWTHIPHIQGCARRCIETKTFRCESFSYDENKRICLLSNVTTNPAVILQNSDSKYYRRLFANISLSYRLEEPSMIVWVEKNQISTGLCTDSLNDTTIDTLCEQFGFGQPLKSATITPIFKKASYMWTVECLRNHSCNYPSEKIAEIDLSTNTIDNGCRSALRCSQCKKNIHFACRSSSVCIPVAEICNDEPQCEDGSDEEGCLNPLWRLVGANDSDTGRGQVFLQNSWSDICLDDLDESHTDIFCQMLGKGNFSRILPAFSQLSTTTFRIICAGQQCWPKGIQECKQGLLNLKCIKTKEQKCGTQNVQHLSELTTQRRFRRIVGGITSIPGRYPWVAALKFRYGNVQHCGATIISERFLVTAAHCFEEDKELSDFVIVAGDWDSDFVEGTEQVSNISRLHFYPLYEDIFQHDIAIIEIIEPLKFNAYVQPICLPPTGYAYQPGQKCVVAGWGSNGSAGIASIPQLQVATLPILDRDSCLQMSSLYAAMSQTAFCAGYLSGEVDSCQGDSGGSFACPFYDHFYLAGVISWGDGCAQKNQPGIYTMTLPYLAWIQNITGLET